MTKEELLGNPEVQYILRYCKENFGKMTDARTNPWIEESKKVARILLASLPEDVLGALNTYYDAQYKANLFSTDINLVLYLEILRELIRTAKNFSQPYSSTPKPLNTPVKQLIKWYQDKKSKKIIVARKEMQERFLYLDPKDQFKILRLFLDGCRTDRMYAYSIYEKEVWDESALDKIIECWKNCTEYREWKDASFLIVHKAPLEVIQQLGEKLYRFSPERAVSTLYKEYCLRLCPNPDFIIERSYFDNPASYYDVVLAFGQQPDKDEFEHELYTFLIWLYTESYYRLYPFIIVRHGYNMTNKYFHYPDKIKGTRFGELRELHLCEVYDIRRMLALAVRFGFNDVVSDFVKYADQVDTAVFQCEGEDGNYYTRDHLYGVNKRALPLKTYFPEKYMPELLAFEQRYANIEDETSSPVTETISDLETDEEINALRFGTPVPEDEPLHDSNLLF